MLESCGRQREGERRRRRWERHRVKEIGRRGGKERHKSIRTHQKVEKEVRGSRRTQENSRYFFLIDSLTTLKLLGW